MPFTLRNLKEDLEDVGSRFDRAPDLGPVGRAGAGTASPESSLVLLPNT